MVDDMQEVRIEEWFDPDDRGHLTAYKHLMETGQWPEGFIPKFVVLGDSWNIILRAKLADAYMESKLNTNLYSSVDDTIEAFRVVHADMEKELSVIRQCRKHLDELLDKVEELKDELESACEKVEGVEDYIEDGLTNVIDGINDIRSGMNEFDEV